ncbi:MAG: hypothetical protein NVS1B4_10350 [Gemmatimonadaceae bacterium]
MSPCNSPVGRRVVGGASIILTVLGASCHTAPNAGARRDRVQQMTAHERLVYLARLRAIAEEDRRSMMVRLGIRQPHELPLQESDPNRPPKLFKRGGSSAWHDSAGNTYTRSPWGAWTNYDESRTGTLPLPDPLILNDGTRVTDADLWWRRRRPEILDIFEREIYGRVPSATPPVSFAVERIDSTGALGSAVVKRVIGSVSNHNSPVSTPSIDITMYLPAGVAHRVPIIVSARGGGSESRVPEEVSAVLALGWAFATVNTTQIQADNGAGLVTGIIGLVNHGRARDPDQWGVLTAWSWGLSRALDYFATDPAIDAGRAAIGGHSRWGKAALLSGALDQRWALVWSSCSGAMGASLETRNWGETIDNVAGVGEYHWMAGNFLKYAGRWHTLPVDAHELIALVAPRPVFVTGGTKDQWSDPHGVFLAAVAADPVYRLLGVRGIDTAAMPSPDEALIAGNIAFRNHDGGHTDAPDWPVFLQFAQRYFEHR